MIGILLVFLSLCPSWGTGTFYFTEFLTQKGSIDTFYGHIMLDSDKTAKLQVIYPDTQSYYIKNDTVVMVLDKDTSSVYKKGLTSAIFNFTHQKGLNLYPFKGGCRVVPQDTMPFDTLYLFGEKYIDSVKVVSGVMEIFFRIRVER